MLQVWFSGSHADVGGGYPGDRGLADTSLDWMLRRAVESGLPLDPAAWRERWAPNPLAARRVSLTSTWRFIAGERSDFVDSLLQQMPVIGHVLRIVLGLFRVRNRPRAIGGEIPTDDQAFVVGLGERLHESVLARYRGPHMPENAATALAAGLPVFHERRTRRAPCPPGQRVTIDDKQALLVDRSSAGLGVAEAPWLDAGTVSAIVLDGERWSAHVAWAEGDRGGLSLLGRREAAGASPEPTG